MPNVRPMGAAEWSALLVLSALWGGSFFLYKVLVGAGLPPLTIVLVRVSIAAVVLLAFVYLSGRRMPGSPRVWRAFLTMGALNNLIPFGLIVFGETALDSGVAAIFNATTPVFGVLLAPLFARDERLGGAKIAGVLLGLAGVAVLIGPAALHGLNLTSAAQLACLGAAFTYACAGIYGRRFAALGVAPIVTAAGQLCGSTILTLPLALLVDRPWLLPPPAPATAWAALGLAVLCTAIAYVLYFRILASAGATNVLLVTFLVPISALLLGSFVLHERLGWSSLAGMALIFAGLAAIDGRVLGAAKAEPAPLDETINSIVV